MIIKKPYAFMIKHFRLIHLILSILLLFLVYKTNSIFTFFSDYAKNGYYAYSINLVASYINMYMFFAIIGIILISSFMYLLMRWKKKSRTFYISIIVFYLVLFFGLIFYFNLFNTILNKALDIKTVRAYRDIVALLYLPQYFFLIYSIIRAIGFDIKKFDFKKDLEDLDISEEDAEEIEVTFGKNAYKYKRKARRTFREFKYYVLENKFFFSVICGGAMLVLILVVFIGINRKQNYKESQFFSVNGVVFKVKESFITSIDYKGNIINEDKKYFIIKVSMENTNIGKVNLDTKSLQLVLGDNYYYPTYSKNDYFIDLGEGYNRNTLYSGDVKEYLLVYEIPYNSKITNSLFRMMGSVNVIRGEIQASTMNVKLSPKEYLTISNVENYDVGEAISLEESTMNNSEFMIKSYQIGDEFIENYEYCLDKCYEGRKIVKADTLGRGRRVILKLDVSTDIDEELYINKYLDNNANFISLFSSIVYKIDGETKIGSFKVKDLGKINTNNVYLEIDEEIEKASTIRLNISVRDKKYSVNLKK